LYLDYTAPESLSQAVRELKIKVPGPKKLYNLDFLGLAQAVTERELENRLVPQVSVPQVSKPAVSPISKSAERRLTKRVGRAHGSQVWKPARQQTGKSALR